MSFRFYKFITNILYLIGENLLKDLPSLSDVYLGCDFLARYNEKDPEFIPNLIESISSNIPDHLNEPFKQTYYKYMNESGSDKFSLNLMNFFDDVSNMKIQLSTIEMYLTGFDTILEDLIQI